MQPTEEWHAVVGYEGIYEVSSFGRVRSVDRTDSADRRLKGRMLRPHPKPVYLAVTLSSAGVHRYFYVHRLVALAFLPEPEEGQEVCHADGDRYNNSASNLRWDSHRANQLDMVRHGNHRNARKTHCPRGHEYSGDNLRVNDSKRSCKTCSRAGDQRRRKADL